MALHGPLTISANLQFRIPVKMARSLHLEVGDDVYLRVSDDDPDVIVLLPAEVVERRYSAGERMEQAARPEARELGQPEAATAPDRDGA